MEKPITTLFMLASIDGKINSGNSDSLDVDQDWCRINGVKEGLHQYYEIEQTTDLFSLNTGRVMVKIGVNERTELPGRSPCSFVIIDNRPHLNENGIKYLCHWLNHLYLVTTNRNHAAYKLKDQVPNLTICEYEKLDLPLLFQDLKEKVGVESLTIQSGGSLNGLLLREDLIDYINIVIAPLLVGGKDTPTMIDGETISSIQELTKLKACKLIECKQLDDSYIQLRYQIIK